MREIFQLDGPPVGDREDFDRVAPLLAQLLTQQLREQGYRTFSADDLLPAVVYEWMVIIDGVRVIAAFVPFPGPIAGEVRTGAATIAGK